MKLRLDTSRSYALALEGGGAKGAYQIGAWKALHEAGVKIDAVAGTSVGALNGSLIVMGDLEKAENIWENIRYSQVMDVDDETMSRLLKGGVRLDELDGVAQQMLEVVKNRGFDVTPLREWIAETVDEKTVRRSPVELFIDTFSLSDGKLLELRAKDLPEGTLCDMLLASAYLPVFRSEKLGGKRYADGGLRDVLPLHVLIEHGYKDILALRLFGIGVERSVKIPDDTRVYTVEPTADLGSTLEFEPEQSRMNLRAGYFDMQRFLYGLRGTKYYVDCDWDEEKSLSLLADAASAGESVSLRSLCEKQLPALAKRLDAEKGDYTDLLVALLESAAEQKGVDPWQILTADALLELAGGEAALAAAFAEPLAARKLARQGATARPAPALLGRKRATTNRRRTDGDPDALNVCLMNDSFPPVVDGVANAVVNYAKILTETEGLCAVATPEYPGVVDDYPFPVVRYPSIDTTKMTGYRAGNPLAPAAVAELAAMDFDIIHSHCPVVSTMLARSLREAIEKPVVFTYHTKFDIDIAKAIRGKTLQEAAVKLLVSNISACDEVWVVSRGAGENLRSLGYAGNYIVMPNGVDLPRGKASGAAVDALSRKWSLPSDKPVYLFIGRIMWYKGLRIILDGLKKVNDAGGDFCMVFVGDGQDRAAVEEYAAQLGLTDKCRFTGTERDRDTIRAWYTRADLLLFPSTFDTNGLVVREAAACSLGSVLIDGSCAAEGITDGDTGILISESGDGLAAALLREGVDRAYFARIGESASEKIYLSWEDSVKNARAQYRSVIERWSSGELPHKRTAGVAEWTGDIAEIIDRARSGWDKAKDALDRYL